MTLVTLDRASHTYGSGPTAVVAVAAASCTVTAGDKIAIMGPSGSGKSTLLHLLSGLESITSGTLTRGDLGVGPEGRPAGVGVVFQGLSLIPSLSAVENIMLPLLVAGMDESTATQSAHVSLGELGIAPLADRLPGEMSGGQAQRVAVARVLATKPRLILADEPTGQLDHEAGTRVIDVLVKAAEHAGAALVVTTHDPVVAARFDKQWTMRDGHLTVISGTTPAKGTTT